MSGLMTMVLVNEEVVEPGNVDIVETNRGVDFVEVVVGLDGVVVVELVKHEVNADLAEQVARVLVDMVDKRGLEDDDELVDARQRMEAFHLSPPSSGPGCLRPRPTAWGFHSSWGLYRAAVVAVGTKDRDLVLDDVDVQGLSDHGTA